MKNVKNVCVLIEKLGLVLSIARRKNKHQLGIPGGKIDPGETPKQALIREVFEELGIVITNLRLVFAAKDDTGDTTATYRADVVGDLPQTPYTGPEGMLVTFEEWSVLTDPVRCTFSEYNRALQQSL